MLLSFVFVIMGITLYQERKTERTLEALRDLSSPRALVIRDGVQKRIAGREVVRGDVLVLAEGDRVPADALVLSCTNLSVDESLLTGESVPVRKAACQDGSSRLARPGGDDLPFVFSGTLVVSGQGFARVQSEPGVHSEIGKIGKCAAVSGVGKDAASEGNRPAGYQAGGCRPDSKLDCGHSLRTHQRALDRWLSWLASPWAWRCCPRNSLLCLPSSWRWVPGASQRCRVLTRQAPTIETTGRLPPCSVSIRPVR